MIERILTFIRGVGLLVICFSILTSGLIPLLLPSGGVDKTFEDWVDIRLVPILPKHH